MRDVDQPSPVSERVVPLTVAATNIHGLGAGQLVRSLIPALLAVQPSRVTDVWLPQDGGLAEAFENRPELSKTRWHRYFRRLPNALSRALECLLQGKRIAGNNDLLVLGDLPYRIAGRQVVFVQTPFLVAASRSASRLTTLKSAISRFIFRLNTHHIYRVVVQTDAMRDGLMRTYPNLRGRIEIVGQPAPAWVLSAGAHPSRERQRGEGLRLFFPASPYPHKNHRLLSAALPLTNVVAVIDVTISPDQFPTGDHRLRCHGTLDPAKVVSYYRACDALVFPSLEESYGLPLVEAMFLGLPVVVADRPYAHALCGPPRPDGAIYFDPTDPQSLVQALEILQDRLDRGWHPDWAPALRTIPADWDEVARRMLALFDD